MIIVFFNIKLKTCFLDGPLQKYKEWVSTFNLDDYQSQTVQILETVPEIQEYFSKLVPQTISETEFWHRYYYKVNQLKELERKRIEFKAALLESEGSSNTTFKARDSVDDFIMREKSDMVVVKSSKDDNTPSSASSDTRQSETGSDGWEKTDIDPDELS